MRTRLAPSPTGALHVGNARTFLVTWLHVRAAGGSIVLRHDDLDGPRVKAGRMREAIEDLTWLGLDWDEDEPPLVQSERAEIYDRTAFELVDRGLAYPCTCTRKEVAEAASAPHGPDGVAYPGTCRNVYSSLDAAREATGRDPALRFVAPEEPVRFEDQLFGAQTFEPARETGDFPVRKTDGTAAYQLATVIDDAASRVDLVIRGSDLLPSTARQILLQRALGLPPVSYLHLPLVVGEDGRRLAKRHGDTRVRHLRQLGWDALRLVGWLAHTLDLAEPGERVTAADLIDRYDPKTLTGRPVVAGAATFTPGVGGG